MKILMLSNRDTTFTASFFDHLYGGLRTLLGSDNIHVYPYSSAYSTGITEPEQLSFMTWNFPACVKTLEEIVDLAKSNYYDLLVVGMIPFEEAQEDYLEILQNCSCPVAAVNSSDYPDMWDFESYLGRPILAEFRKESFTADSKYELQSHGMRFDFVTDSFPEKKYDVCAIFGRKDGSPIATVREQVIDRIKRAFPSSIAEYTSIMPFSEYMDSYRSAWIGMSIRGIGIHTLRIYEIIAAKAFCVSDEFPIIVPDWFAGPENIEYYDYADLDGMENLIRKLLADKDRLKEKIQNAYCHLWTYHNIYHNAERFLEIVRQRMGSAEHENSIHNR